MPFTGHKRGVPGCFQNFGDGHAIPIKMPLIPTQRRRCGHRAHAGLMSVKPRHQRGSRGAAAGRVVKLRITQSVLREPIEIGRLNFASVTSDIRKAHIIGHDQNNIRPRRAGSSHRQTGPTQQNREQARHARIEPPAPTTGNAHPSGFALTPLGLRAILAAPHEKTHHFHFGFGRWPTLWHRLSVQQRDAPDGRLFYR